MNRCRLTTAAGLLALLLAGCGGSEAPADGAAAVPQASLARPSLGDAPTPPTADEVRALAARSSSARGGPLAAATSGFAVDTSNRDQVRLFYRTIYAASEGVASGWAGNLASCNAGDTSVDFKLAEIRRVNWFRAMAGIPANVVLDSGYSSEAQQAALYMAANQTLTHNPPPSGNCYSTVVSDAAGKSNLAYGTSGVDSIASYMDDYGVNNAPVGHRRWILYPQTQTMGVGDIDGAPYTNALWIMDGNYGSQRPATRDGFVAWPNKGYVPYNTVYARWSFAYPGANFAGATVSMTQNGTPISTTKLAVQDGYGENTIVWFPQGFTDGMEWSKPDSDTTYTVTISGITNAPQSQYTYTVVVFDPAQASGTDGPLAITGSDTATAGQANPYTVSAISGATSYQWRTLATSPYTLNDGAEAGGGNFTASTSGGYDVVSTLAHATGAASFRLAHSQAVDQSLQLNQPLAAGPTSSLQFNSRLTSATPDETALVQVSTDDGATWTTVYTQAGNGSPGEGAFTPKSASLAAFAGRTLRIRFAFAYRFGGQYYLPTSTAVGWYIDDVHTTDLSAVSANAPVEASNTFQFTPSVAGSVLLQARPGMYGAFGEWGPAKAVSVVAGNPSDCLFNWAEAQLPGVFSPHATSFGVNGFYLRYYASSDLYLGIASIDIPNYGVLTDHVYYYVSGGLHDLGTKASWYATAGCQ